MSLVMVCSIKYFDHFYWLVFLWLSFVSSEYNQDIGPLSTIWFINYMILSVYSLFFILLKMSFWKAKIFSLIKSSLSVHSFLVHAFDEKSEKSLSRSKVINLLGWRTGFMEDNVSMDLGVGMVQDDSSTLQVLCALFLLILHQLHLRSSGIRSQTLGTPDSDHAYKGFLLSSKCFIGLSFIL